MEMIFTIPVNNAIIISDSKRYIYGQKFLTKIYGQLWTELVWK